MKKILITLTLLFSTNLFALSPFSLEKLKEVNLKVIDKNQLTSKSNLEIIKNKLQNNLEYLGVKTKSDNFSNLIVKIQGVKLKEDYAIHISLFLVEDSISLRDDSVEYMSITYYKDDFFDSNSEDIQTDIYESVISYLLADFINQYKQENS